MPDAILMASRACIEPIIPGTAMKKKIIESTAHS